MSASVLYMSMSLDGYIAGPNDKPGNPGGDGFDRLHEWLWDLAGGEFARWRFGPAGELWDEMEATGAVLAGRSYPRPDHRGLRRARGKRCIAREHTRDGAPAAALRL